MAFIIVACLAVAVTLFTFMKSSADDARKQSDDIMKEFKRVDESLKESNYKIDSANKELLNALQKDTAYATGR